MQPNTYVALYYCDATYTYKEDLSPPPHYISFGKVTKQTKDFIMLRFLKNHQRERGVVIPRAALTKGRTFTPLFPQTKPLLPRLHTLVSIEWIDMTHFDEEDYTPRLEKALTSGILYKKTKRFVVIKDPTTIIYTNKHEGELHPQKLPLYYFIPRALIQKIKIL